MVPKRTMARARLHLTPVLFPAADRLPVLSPANHALQAEEKPPTGTRSWGRKRGISQPPPEVALDWKDSKAVIDPITTRTPQARKKRKEVPRLARALFRGRNGGRGRPRLHGGSPSECSPRPERLRPRRDKWKNSKAQMAGDLNRVRMMMS